MCHHQDEAIDVLRLRIASCNKPHPWKSIKNNFNLKDMYMDYLSIFPTRQKGSKRKQTDSILLISGRDTQTQ